MLAHNWRPTINGGYVCVDENDAGHPGHNCDNCRAQISFEVVVKIRESFNGVEAFSYDGSPSDLFDAMDKLWHSKLRPMAEFACLVEESACR